jgi:uncharacterized protein YegP (UPF0339 family)
MVEIKKTKKGQYRVYSKAANNKILQFSEELKTLESVYKHIRSMMVVFDAPRLRVKGNNAAAFMNYFTTSYSEFKYIIGM